jgi:hypothetical protein
MTQTSIGAAGVISFDLIKCEAGREEYAWVPFHNPDENALRKANRG